MTAPGATAAANSRSQPAYASMSCRLPGSGGVSPNPGRSGEITRTLGKMGDDRLETVVLAAEAVDGDDGRLGILGAVDPVRGRRSGDLDLAPLDGDRVEERGVRIRDGHPSSLRVLRLRGVPRERCRRRRIP